MNNITTTISHSVYVLISLDTLKTNKSLKYHDIIIEHLSYFNQYHIPVYIAVPDSNEYIDTIQKYYQSSIIYICTNKNYYIDKNLLRTKSVYGKEHEIIYTRLEVYEDEICIYSVNHINKKTLLMAYLKALESLFKKYKKNFKKKLTRI